MERVPWRNVVVVLRVASRSACLHEKEIKRGLSERGACQLSNLETKGVGIYDLPRGKADTIDSSNRHGVYTLSTKIMGPNKITLATEVKRPNISIINGVERQKESCTVYEGIFKKRVL